MIRPMRRELGTLRRLFWFKHTREAPAQQNPNGTYYRCPLGHSGQVVYGLDSRDHICTRNGCGLRLVFQRKLRDDEHFFDVLKPIGAPAPSRAETDQLRALARGDAVVLGAFHGRRAAERKGGR